MARAVDVSIVSILSLILHVRCVDGNTSVTLLRGLINVLVCNVLGIALLRQNFGDGGGKSGLAVIDVTNSTHVHVRLGTGVSTQSLGLAEDRCSDGCKCNTLGCKSASQTE